MALYEVVRMDESKPGEFVNALVVAGGHAQACALVAHLLPEGAKVEADHYDVRGPHAGRPTRLLMTQFDEREPAATATPDYDPLTYMD